MTTLVRYVLAHDLTEAVRLVAKHLSVPTPEPVVLFESPEEAKARREEIRKLFKGDTWWKTVGVLQVSISITEYETKEAAPCPSNDSHS